MKKYTRNNRILLILLTVLNAVYGGLTAIVPIAAGRIIDWTPAAGQTFFGISGFRGLGLLCLALLAGVVLSGLLKAVLKSGYIRRVRRQLETDVFKAAMRSGNSSASVLTLFCTEIDVVMDGYFTNHGEIVTILVPFAVALAYSLSVSWLTIAVIFGCFTVLLLLNQVLLSPIKKLMVTLSQMNESVNRILLGFLNAITSLKIYGGIGYASGRIREVLAERNQAEKAKAKQEVLVEGVNCLFSTLLQIVPLAIIAVMVVSGQLTIGAALAIMLLFEKIVSPIDQVSMLRQEYAENKPYRERIEAFIAENAEPQDEPASRTGKETAPELYIRDLCVDIDGKPILRNFNTVFENKKKYLVVGRNGTGKSTLLKVLTKQIPAYGGSVSLSGRELEDIPARKLFETVGIIPQHPEIFEDTLLNNITLGRPVDYARVLKALKLAGLSENRLQEKVSENRSNFSGGELQRIILARMFCNPKPVYCLDEVVSGLQYSLARAIENTIIDHLDATVINVSHRTDAETLQKYDAVINMNTENNAVYTERDGTRD